jgi:hypothetical protein
MLTVSAEGGGQGGHVGEEGEEGNVVGGTLGAGASGNRENANCD